MHLLILLTKPLKIAARVLAILFLSTYIYIQDASAIDDGATIDIMVVYTTAAKAASSDINSEIQLAVDETNTIFTNSGINTQLRLVYTTETSYTSTGNYNTDMNHLADPADGYMDDIPVLRDNYNADLVSLWVEQADPSIAGIAGEWETVLKRSLATPKVFPHEIGHNLGASHSHAYPDPCLPDSYNCGYEDPDGDFSTVMGAYCAIGLGCPLIPYFSTPLLTYNGKPIGVPEGSSNAADNAKAINNFVFTVANYEQSDGSPQPNSILPTNPMSIVRYRHTANLLPSGGVLIAGGWIYGSSTYFSSAEMYDPLIGLFTVTDSMGVARGGHTATTLKSGNILVAGGYDGNTSYKNHSSAEIYDAALMIFKTTGSMTIPRSGHSSTLLSDGRVLIAGGATDTGITSAAELYDPITGVFTATGSMTVSRTLASSVLLPSGKVLITGGYDGSQTLSSAELYDPATGTFTATSSMSTPRAYHSLTLLPNGQVLSAGGYTSLYTAKNASIEIFNPGSEIFSSSASLLNSETEHSATVLQNGLVLIVGIDEYLYDPATGTFVITTFIPWDWFDVDSRVGLGNTATLLRNGRVLLTGGRLTSNLSIADLFYPYPAIDSIAPTNVSVIINSDDITTNSRDVTLNISADDDTGVVGYYVSESATTPIAQVEYWAPIALTSDYNENVAYRLSNGAGVKNVYIWFKDVAGNVSLASSDSIDLTIDNTSPVTTSSPTGGYYTSTQSVSLNCSDSESGCATTYYTTDGSTPTISSNVYSGPIDVSASTTIRFFSVDNAGNSEMVKSDTYTIGPADSTPPVTAASPANEYWWLTTIEVTLICIDGSSGCAKTYYTTDGTIPTTSSSVYTSPFTMSVNDTLRFSSVDNAGNTESVKEKTYIFDNTSPTTTISPAGGTYSSELVVSLSCADDISGCSGTYYRVGDSGTYVLYTGPISVTANTTIWYYSVDNGGIDELQHSQIYVIDTSPPTTTATPPGGSYLSPQSVNLICADSNSGCGATYFTTDGSTPTTGSTIYSGPISVSSNTVLKYFSVDSASNSEGIQTQSYVIGAPADSVPPITIATPSGGTYTSAQSVTLNCTDDSSGCSSTYYTTDGSIPTSSSTVYSGPISVATNTTLKFFSTDYAANSESPKSETYVINIVTDTTAPVTTPTPAGGTFSSDQTVSLMCSDTGVGCNVTYYTTDGSNPTTSSQEYSSPILISTSTALKYFSVDAVGNSEPIKTENYVITRALLVQKSGSGSGIVNSTPSGIDCGADCTESYTDGTSVDLTANPDSGSEFIGWTGACSGTGACIISMSANETVSAQFDNNSGGSDSQPSDGGGGGGGGGGAMNQEELLVLLLVYIILGLYSRRERVVSNNTKYRI